MHKNQKKITVFKKRINDMKNILGIRQRELAKNIGVTESYITSLKKAKIKYGGIKFWDGIRKNYPLWESYLRGEELYPPGSIKIPFVSKKQLKKLYKPDYILFSRNVRFFMGQAGLNQEAMAEKIECSQATIHRYRNYEKEEDIKRPQKIFLTAFAKFFHVSVNDLLYTDRQALRIIEHGQRYMEIQGEDLVQMARAVLASHTKYGASLAINIRLLHKALQEEKSQAKSSINNEKKT